MRVTHRIIFMNYAYHSQSIAISTKYFFTLSHIRPRHHHTGSQKRRIDYFARRFQLLSYMARDCLTRWIYAAELGPRKYYRHV